MPCLYHNMLLKFKIIYNTNITQISSQTLIVVCMYLCLSQNEKLWALRCIRLFFFFFSSLIASIYPSCLWGFLHGLKATEWLAMRFLVVCACWCCWGDSMGHEWLELRQRRAESAWGGCAVHHNVQQVRWGCFSRDVNSFQEWKTSNIILLFFYLIGLLCFGIEEYWCRGLYI